MKVKDNRKDPPDIRSGSIIKALRNYDAQVLNVLEQCMHDGFIDKQSLNPPLAGKLLSAGLFAVRNDMEYATGTNSLIPMTYFELTAKGKRVAKAGLTNKAYHGERNSVGYYRYI